VAALCREGLEAAVRKGIRISVDLNYRAKLWQYGVSPVSVMPGLVDYCDLVMGNLWAAESLLGIPVDKDVHQDGNKQRYLDHSIATSEAILRQFPRCARVAHTFRFEKVAEGLRYYATLFERVGGFHVSREFRTDAVVDKVGSGDCFMGGLIFAGLQGWTPQQTIDFAAAAAIGKLQEKGDATRQTVSQVLTTIERHA
jgi:2-dehydro-3-deoxygluconokinase